MRLSSLSRTLTMMVNSTCGSGERPAFIKHLLCLLQERGGRADAQASGGLRHARYAQRTKKNLSSRSPASAERAGVVGMGALRLVHIIVQIGGARPDLAYGGVAGHVLHEERKVRVVGHAVALGEHERIDISQQRVK